MTPLLVQVVEELGDRAGGPCACLKVVEIPADVKWTIEEYDGLEWVAEAHRTVYRHVGSLSMWKVQTVAQLLRLIESAGLTDEEKEQTVITFEGLKEMPGEVEPKLVLTHEQRVDVG